MTVTGVNDAPVCEDVSITTDENSVGTNSPSCTDVDDPASSLSYTVTQPAKGTSSYVAPDLRFNPNGQYEGLDTSETDTTNGDFTYRASDGDAFSAAADVEVTVNGVNDAPVCQPVSITTNENTADSTAPDCNDPDVEPLAYTVTQPTKGVASEDDLDLTFDPDGDFEGLDTGETDTTNGDFTYTAHDGTTSSNESAVQVTVNGVNDAPVCQPVSITTNENTAGSTGPDCTDVDDPVAALTYAVTQPSKGVASENDVLLTFNPNGQYEGLDTGETDTTNGDFEYTASDAEADSAEANVQVTVTGVNDAPVCLDRTITTDEDTVGTVAATCTDVDVEPLTVSVTQPSKGVASENDVLLTFNPNGQYESLNAGDTDTTNGDFTYKAHDGTVYSNVADVAVTVTGVNDGPSLTVTPGSVTAQYSDPIDGVAGTAGNQPVSISATDVDTPGTGLIFSVKDSAACSTVTLLPASLAKTDNAGNATLPGTRTATISGELTEAPGTYARCIEVRDGAAGATPRRSARR